MLDRYWWGSVKRISPEAPVPVVELQKSTFAPGGAANVAANIAGLGRVILATPGTPSERVEVLRRALADVLRDPAYIAEIRKVNLAAGFAGADEVRAAVEKAMTTLDEKGLAEMREIALERYY